MVQHTLRAGHLSHEHVGYEVWAAAYEGGPEQVHDWRRISMITYSSKKKVGSVSIRTYSPHGGDTHYFDPGDWLQIRTAS